MFLVPEWASEAIVLEPLEDGRFVVNEDASPVIEYTPCVLNSTTRLLTVGRLYWCFDGELTAEEKRQLDRMFRWVRAQAMASPFDRRFRIFEHAASNGYILDSGFGITRASPPWTKPR